MPEPKNSRRLTRVLTLIGSAALVAAGLHYGVRWPWLLLLPLGALLGWLGLRWRARRRVRRLLLSGKAEELVRAWFDTLEGLPHADTTVPLLHATALVACGLTERARRALEKAQRGDAWHAAREHRLLVETLLDAFEGDRDLALTKAQELRRLPLPEVSGDLRNRITLLREAVAAVARAFAHRAEADDATLLREAARRNALIHWPLRYAAAVVCIDDGHRSEAKKLLEGAPEWPEESAFRAFHAELREHAEEPVHGG